MWLGAARSRTDKSVTCSLCVLHSRTWQWVLHIVQLSMDRGLGSACIYTMALESTEQAAQWRLFCSFRELLDGHLLRLTKLGS